MTQWPQHPSGGGGPVGGDLTGDLPLVYIKPDVVLKGNPTLETPPAAGDNDASIASTGWVKAELTAHWQPLDSELEALAGVTSDVDTLPYFDAPGHAAVTSLTAVGRSIIGAATQAAARTAIGAQQQSTSLDAIRPLTPAADQVPYFSGPTTAARTAFLPSGRALVGLSGSIDQIAYYTGASTAAVTAFNALGRSLVGATSGPAALASAGLYQAPRVITAGGSLLFTDPNLIHAVGGYGIVMPANCVPGQRFTFVDYTKNWSTSNLTITPATGHTVNGTTSWKGTNNGQVVTLAFTGSDWELITNNAPPYQEPNYPLMVRTTVDMQSGNKDAVVIPAGSPGLRMYQDGSFAVGFMDDSWITGGSSNIPFSLGYRAKGNSTSLGAISRVRDYADLPQYQIERVAGPQIQVGTGVATNPITPTGGYLIGNVPFDLPVTGLGKDGTDTAWPDPLVNGDVPGIVPATNQQFAGLVLDGKKSGQSLGRLTYNSLLFGDLATPGSSKLLGAVGWSGVTSADYTLATTTASGVHTSTTTLTVPSTAGFASSGTVLVAGAGSQAYTAKTATTFTLVNAISCANGALVQALVDIQLNNPGIRQPPDSGTLLATIGGTPDTTVISYLSKSKGGAPAGYSMLFKGSNIPTGSLFLPAGTLLYQRMVVANGDNLGLGIKPKPGKGANGTGIQAGQGLGRYNFCGSFIASDGFIGGSKYLDVTKAAAAIAANAEENFTDSAQGTNITLATVAPGTTGAREAVTITGLGIVELMSGLAHGTRAPAIFITTVTTNDTLSLNKVGQYSNMNINQIVLLTGDLVGTATVDTPTPGDATHDEVQRIIMNATAGVFRIQIQMPNGQTLTTDDIDFNTRPGGITTALQDLRYDDGSIVFYGGDVQTSKTGGNTYWITFGGPPVESGIEFALTPTSDITISYINAGTNPSPGQVANFRKMPSAGKVTFKHNTTLTNQIEMASGGDITLTDRDWVSFSYNEASHRWEQRDAKLADNSVTTTKIAPLAVTTAAVADGAITGAKLRNSIATSVMGNTGASSGTPSDIQAGTDGHVLRRAAGALGFGTIPSSSVTGLGTVAATSYPGSPGTTKFLREDGTFVAASGSAPPVQEDGTTKVSVPAQLDFTHGLDVNDLGSGHAEIRVDETELTGLVPSGLRRTLAVQTARVAGTVATGAYGVTTGGATPLFSASGNTWASVWIDPADYAIAGTTTYFRLSAVAAGNVTASTSNFAVQLVPAGAPSGGSSVWNPNPGAAVATVNFTNPTTTVTGTSGDFTIASAGWYFFQITVSVNTTAAASLTMFSMKVDVHNV